MGHKRLVLRPRCIGPGRARTQISFISIQQVTKTERVDGMLEFHPYFEITHNQNGRDGSTTRRPHFTSKEILLYSFLLKAKWNPALPNACRGINHLKISKDPTGNRTRNLPSCGVVPPHAPPPTS